MKVNEGLPMEYLLVEEFNRRVQWHCSKQKQQHSEAKITMMINHFYRRETLEEEEERRRGRSGLVVAAKSSR